MRTLPFITTLLVTFVTLLPAILGDTECPNISSRDLYNQFNIKEEMKVRVVQYNVEWLFTDYYKSSDCPGDGCTWKNESEANKHIKTISNVIRDLSPTMIHLCEVEGCDELQQISQNISMSPDDIYEYYLKKGKDTSTGQNVGLLTKITPTVSLYRTEDRADYPIAGSQCNYTGEAGDSGVSKHYITEFSIHDIQIAFIGVHFVAFPTDAYRCAEREAQATVMQNVIYNYITKGYEVLFLGDLNDYDGEVLDVNHNKPKSMVLRILKGMDGVHANKYHLHNVAEKIPEMDRYSAWWDKNKNCVATPNEFSSIDHMLVTDRLFDLITNAYYYHGYTESCDIYESDHYPLIVEFDF